MTHCPSTTNPADHSVNLTRGQRDLIIDAIRGTNTHLSHIFGVAGTVASDTGVSNPPLTVSYSRTWTCKAPW